MSTDIAPPSRQKLQAETASKPKRITGALKVACDLMVWGGEDGLAVPWDEAAKHANMRVRSMRLALEKPWVRQYLREQRHVFAMQASAANISRCVVMRDESPNQMARMKAAEFIEQAANEAEHVAAHGQQAHRPGCVIMITRDLAHLVEQRQGVTIDVAPAPPELDPADE